MNKPFYSLLPAILWISSTVSAQLPDSCAAPTLVRHHYLGSAKVIALRQMLNDPFWADSVYIPESLYNPVLHALSAVFNATQYPERDTVTECLDILAYGTPYSLTGLSLSADTSDLWAKNLHQDIFPTGNATVDDLMLRYNIQKRSSYQFSKFFFFLEVEEPLNTIALAKLFNVVPGAHADADVINGDGDDISLDTISGGVSLTYRTGWGDCPAGCIFERQWTFRVNPDCSVQYLGAQGDTPNFKLSCGSNYDCLINPLCLNWLQDSLQHYLALYPNCPAMEPSVRLSLYQNFNSTPVLGIHVFVGIDAEFTDFFYCNGDYLGTCYTSIIGSFCQPPYLNKYQHGDALWNCTESLPTPANCVSAAPEIPDDALSIQLSPNPTHTGQIWLKADWGRFDSGRLSITDLYGKCILEKNLDARALDEPLQLSGQIPGIYFVRLEVGSNIVTRKLLLLR